MICGIGAGWPVSVILFVWLQVLLGVLVLIATGRAPNGLNPRFRLEWNQDNSGIFGLLGGDQRLTARCLASYAYIPSHLGVTPSVLARCFSHDENILPTALVRMQQV